MKKRILFLARHFPPLITGGTRRSRLIARGLSERGHEVFVVAPLPPEGMEGLAVAHPQPAPPTIEAQDRRPSLRDIARAKLLLPDPDIRWALRARRAVNRLEDRRFDWIISSSPPESLHAAASLLQRDLGARWLADFRDHWIDNALRLERRNAPLRAFVERRLAQRMLKNAAAITAVDRAIADELLQYAPSTPAHIIGHFAEAAAPTADLDPDAVNLVHTGSFTLSDPDRTIDPLLDAFAAARAKNPRLKLHLAGRLTDAETNAARNHAFAEDIERHGVVGYEEARGLQTAADLLILAIAPDQHGTPGKYAEYKLTGKPILVLQGDRLLRAAAEKNGETSFEKAGDLAAAAQMMIETKRQPFKQAGAEGEDAYRAAVDAFDRILTEND